MKKQGIISFFSAILTLFICFLLIADSKGTSDSAKESVNVCLTVIIPSLFAFMVFSQIIIKSGIADFLLYPFYRISPWFKGSGREFSIFVLSLIGGYPVGIKLLKDYIAYNKNYTAIAEKMLCFCYCGSPTFIIQIAGISLLSSFKAGLMIYLSNLAACFTAAIIINLSAKNDRREKTKPSVNLSLSLTDITDSISSTVKALGVICGTILAFNIILELMKFTEIMSLLSKLNMDKITASLIEISNISLFKGSNFALMPIFSALTSFGGFCIIIQTAALSKGEIPLRNFLLSRLPIALLSGIYAFLFGRLFPIALESSNINGLNTVLYSVNPICSICLIIMIFILLRNTADTKP